MESKTKKAVRNAWWSIIFKSLTAILPFVVRTIIIRLLGMEYAGISSLFTSILSVLSLAELGISETIIFSMYKPYAEGDREKVNALLNFYRKAYLIIGFIILAVGLLLTIRIDIFVSGEYPDTLDLRILFLIYLLSTVSSYFLFAYQSVLFTVSQRNDIEYKISIVTTILREVIQIVVLVLFRNYYIYIVFLPLFTIIHNIIRTCVVRKKYPDLKCSGKIDDDTKKNIKKQVGGLMIGKVVVVSRNAFDSIIISSFLGLIAVGIYNNYYYIMNTVYAFVVYFAAALRGGIGNNVATKPKEQNYKDLLNLTNVFWWIYGLCSVMMLCLFQPFMTIWVGAENLYSIWVVILFVVYFYFLCNALIFSQYMEAKGLFWEHKWRYILEAVGNLALNIILIQFLKEFGVVLATVITVIFLTNIYGSLIGFKHYFTECPKRKYYFLIATNLLICAIGGGVCYFICSLIALDGILGLFVKAVVTFVAYMLVCLLLTFYTKRFKEMKNYLKVRFKTVFRKGKSDVSLDTATESIEQSNEKQINNNIENSNGEE